jgi:hypothetical protein
MSDLKAMYRTDDGPFSPEMTLTFAIKLIYRKRTWKIPDSKSGVIEGLRYGRTGQEAALYER